MLCCYAITLAWIFGKISTCAHLAHQRMPCRLQGGRFDAPDRLFCSMREAWESATTGSADVKELIPEFFLSNSR